MTFAAALKKRRKALGLTQSQLAPLIGYDKQTVSNWETGRSMPWEKVERTVRERLEMEPVRDEPPVTFRPIRPRVSDRIIWED